MKTLRKLFGKSNKLLSIGIVVVFIMAIFSASGTAATPTGPFTLEYYAGENGVIIGFAQQYVELGGSGTEVEALSDPGYLFVEWSDGSTDNPRTDTNVTGDLSVTANFAIDIYTLNYYAGEGGTLSGDTSQTVEYDKNGTAVEAIPNPGYHFVEWSDSNLDNPRIDYWVYCDIDVIAYFAIDTFSLDYSAGSNGTVSGEQWQTVDYGTDGTEVEAIPDPGYHFVEWSDGSTENPRTDTNVTDDVEVTACFAIDTYTLNYAAGPNGSISGDKSQTVDYEADGTEVEAVADAGYQFVNWSDGSTDNPRTDYDVTEHVAVTANFSFLYTVTFDSQGGSGVPDQFVVSGGKVDYPAAPTKAGVYFAGWYKEASCDTIWHSNIDLISGNTTLYAKWNDTAPKVAILYKGSMAADIQAKLASTGLFSQIDLISLYNDTPSLPILKQYNAVIIYSDTSSIYNPVGWGDVLADYVDYGGGVVFTAFTFATPNESVGINGRISSEEYLIFTDDGYSSGYHLTLVADAASDSILNGVNSFEGGQSSYHSKVSLTAGANLIAHWSNDYPLVATKQIADKGRIAGLNIFPPSSDIRSDLWDSSTDGALLMANSLMWVSSTGGTISPPTITSNDSVSVEENQTAVTTVTATDPDSSTFTYSISGGFDANLFSINSSTGVLSFKVAPDFESPKNFYKDNIYEVTVQVSDGELSSSQNIRVTVTDLNEAPVITSDGGEAAANLDAKEKQTAVTTVTATDPEDYTLTYSITGGFDEELFTIDASTGVLSFKTAPDFELKADANADGIYEVTVEVSDGTLTDTQSIYVTVTLQTPVDMLNDLKEDINDLQAEGIFSRSTANGFIRTIDKAIAKINAGDSAGAIKLLNSLKTTINRQTSKKIPSDVSGNLVAQIDLVIARLQST